MTRSVSTQPEIPNVDLIINDHLVSVPSGSIVAAALLHTGIAIRESVSGEPRGPLCAMGICMECAAIVNGVPRVRTCRVIAQQGMKVVTG